MQQQTSWLSPHEKIMQQPKSMNCRNTHPEEQFHAVQCELVKVVLFNQKIWGRYAYKVTVEHTSIWMHSKWNDDGQWSHNINVPPTWQILQMSSLSKRGVIIFLLSLDEVLRPFDLLLLSNTYIWNCSKNYVEEWPNYGRTFFLLGTEKWLRYHSVIFLVARENAWGNHFKQLWIALLAKEIREGSLTAWKTVCHSKILWLSSRRLDSVVEQIYSLEFKIWQDRHIVRMLGLWSRGLGSRFYSQWLMGFLCMSRQCRRCGFSK